MEPQPPVSCWPWNRWCHCLVPQVSDAGGRFEAIGVGNSFKGAVVLRRGLFGSSTIVHRCGEILLEDAGDRGLAASDPGSNTLLTHALGSEGKDYFFSSREHCLSAITARYFMLLCRLTTYKLILVMTIHRFWNAILWQAEQTTIYYIIHKSNCTETSGHDSCNIMLQNDTFS